MEGSLTKSFWCVTHSYVQPRKEKVQPDLFKFRQKFCTCADYDTVTLIKKRLKSCEISHRLLLLQLNKLHCDNCTLPMGKSETKKAIYIFTMLK